MKQRPNPKKNMVITLPYVHSRVDSNTFTMGGQPYARVGLNPVPKSTLSPSQGLWIWPLYPSTARHCVDDLSQNNLPLGHRQQSTKLGCSKKVFPDLRIQVFHELSSKKTYCGSKNTTR